jgi:hypothetical protein
MDKYFIRQIDHYSRQKIKSYAIDEYMYIRKGDQRLFWQPIDVDQILSKYQFS